MNKSQVVWLIIRLIGLYLALLALTSLFSLIGSIPALFTLPKLDAPNRNANVSMPQNQPIRVQPIGPNGVPDVNEQGGKTDKDESITEKFKGENFTTFVWFLVLTGFYGSAAWYLLRDGRLFYSLLMREAPNGSSIEREPEVTTLDL